MQRTALFIAAFVALILALALAGCRKTEPTAAPETQAPPAATAEAGQPAASTVPETSTAPVTAEKPEKTAAAKPTKAPVKPPKPAAAAKPVSIPGLVIKDVKVGSGATATPGKTVTVHYTGRLTSGKKFDSSLDRNEPFTFTLGAGEVIPGWDKGVAGMRVGGKRKLTISPELGYGERGVGSIPPNSTLVFDVELLGVGEGQ